MEVIQASPTRGITVFYTGHDYIVHSSYYGVVGYSKLITRSGDDKNCMIDLVIDIESKSWYWPVGLAQIVTTAIRKSEKQFVKDKLVSFDIEYKKVMSRFRLNVEMIRRKVR